MKINKTISRNYVDEVMELERAIKKATTGKLDMDSLNDIQNDLDEIAKRFQYDEKVGSARYKLYELQALIYYFQYRNEDSLNFIREAIRIKESSYPKAEQLIKKIASSRTAKSDEIIFFHKSPSTAAILTFVTFNLYLLYWSYKHWRLIRLSTNKRTYPIASSILQIFTTYPLFKLIKDNAHRNGYKKFNKAVLAALSYIFLIFITNRLLSINPPTTADAVTWTVFALLPSLLCISLIVATVQRAANAHNIAVLGKNYDFRKIFVGEIIFTILGVVLALALTAMIFISASSVDIDSSSPEVKNAYEEMESLRHKYDNCSSELETRRGSVNEYRDYEVASFNSDLEACEDTRLELNKAVDEYNILAGFN